MEFTDLLVSDSTPKAANGSGWSETYTCHLYTISLDSFSKFSQQWYSSDKLVQLKQQHGFLICLQTIHIINPLYCNFSFTRKPTVIDIIHLPPASLSSLQHVDDVVDNILATSRAPSDDRNLLVDHLFSIGCHYEQTSASTLVPLVFDFYITVVLRNAAECTDWVYGGNMNSVILRSLRATGEVISNLETTTSSMNCMVCREGFEHGEKANRLPCSHEFHHSCIAEWLRCNHRCPVCRFQMPWVQASHISDEDSTASSYHKPLPMMNRLFYNTIFHSIFKKVKSSGLCCCLVRLIEVDANWPDTHEY